MENHIREVMEKGIELSLKNILSNECKNRVTYHTNWANKITVNFDILKQIDCVYKQEEDTIEVFLLFGSTIPTSKSLASQNIDLDNIDSLIDEEWKIENHIRVCNSRGRCDVDEIIENRNYWKIWKKNNYLIKQYRTQSNKESFRNAYSEMIKQNILSGKNVAIENLINNTKMTRYTLMPALYMKKSIKLVKFKKRDKYEIETLLIKTIIEGLKPFNREKDFISMLDGKKLESLGVSKSSL